MIEKLLDRSNLDRIQELSERLDFGNFVSPVSETESHMVVKQGDSIKVFNLLKRDNVSCVETIAQPGTVAEPHVHPEYEVVVLYEGEMEFFIGSSSFLLRAGNSIYVPKNVTHSAEIMGDVPAKMICITVPHSPDFPGKLQHGYQ